MDLINQSFRDSFETSTGLHVSRKKVMEGINQSLFENIIIPAPSPALNVKENIKRYVPTAIGITILDMNFGDDLTLIADEQLCKTKSGASSILSLIRNMKVNISPLF